MHERRERSCLLFASATVNPKPAWQPFFNLLLSFYECSDFGVGDLRRHFRRRVSRVRSRRCRHHSRRSRSRSRNCDRSRSRSRENPPPRWRSSASMFGLASAILLICITAGFFAAVLLERAEKQQRKISIRAFWGTANDKCLER